MGRLTRGVNDLATVHPELAKQWHPTKNGGLAPSDVSSSARTKVWWLGPCGHEWQASVNSRTAGGAVHGCPICSGTRVLAGFNDLASQRPDIARQWDADANEGLTAEEVTPNSNRKVGWVCERGHRWLASVSSRTRGTGCPYCSGNKAWPGFNDLTSKRPDLASQWNAERNGTLRPDEVTTGSNRKVWWHGPCGHEWQAVISARVQGHGCPYCAGISVLPGFNDLATRRPELSKQWDAEKNTLKPNEVPLGTQRKAWWLCDKGHSWEASVASRAQGNGCPYCSNQKLLPEYNDLATMDPELARQWHPAKNNGLTPKDVIAGTARKVWWRCDRGHEWQATINSRSNKGNGCPYCSGQRVLPGFNDLATLYPDIAKEWDYDRNGALTPSQVGKGSIRKVWWRCEKGHEWRTTVNLRTNQGTGCPKCQEGTRTSIPEQAVVYYLRRDIDAGTINQWKPEIDGTVWEVDAYVPSLNTAVEYDGIFYHRKAAGRNDEQKGASLRKAGVRLIRVRESDAYSLEDDAISYDAKHDKWRNLDGCIAVLERMLGLEDAKDIDTRRDQPEILAQFERMRRENSLAARCPDVAAQWDYERNEGLTPEQFTYSASSNVWWTCGKGHHWQAVINSRTNPSLKSGCPYCANRKVLAGDNDLATRRSDIAQEWDAERNGELTPSGVAVGSSRKVWWRCRACGYEWRTTVVSRTSDKSTGCPACAGRVANEGVNDLATCNPQLAAQWHPTRNGVLTPAEVTTGSQRKVWWKDELGHEWQASIANRNRGGGCPYCGSRKVLQGFNDLATINPELASQWDSERNGDLKPADVMPRSGRKVWWLCPYCGRSWAAVIANRIAENGCPSCAHKRAAANKE
ncbi:zinc-ribbon domain-containing protein [Bifidobacterium bifidum]|uniref:zinc-ribbon domain-containing protein n=1 Tax=Bifidobacterium bifidum TaxID=1681 RepID=UPI0022E59B10|nr:zinc-ribbon domain-containing protein [Bifidobacterium bifidum]